MSTSLPFISDFWQHRCNRLIGSLPEDHALKSLNRNLWQSFKEETHRLLIPGWDEEPLSIAVHSVQQGPTRTQAFYAWQHIPESFSLTHRIRAAHASLRCALVNSGADKIIGVVAVNIKELGPDQADRFCQEVAKWWDGNEHTFATPFSELAVIMLNWLDGLYGDKPTGSHPSLDALRELKVDRGSLIVQTAIRLFDILQEEQDLGRAPKVAVVGAGAWAKSIAEEIGLREALCRQVSKLPLEGDYDQIILLHLDNVLEPDLAEKLNCRSIIEILPGQINPDCDEIILRKGITVIPDSICTSAAEMVENWWIGGRRVPDWKMALQLELKALWKEVQERKETMKIGHHEAALLLALERLSQRWDNNV